MYLTLNATASETLIRLEDSHPGGHDRIGRV